MGVGVDYERGTPVKDLAKLAATAQVDDSAESCDSGAPDSSGVCHLIFFTVLVANDPT